jgi:hypothetical protein
MGNSFKQEVTLIAEPPKANFTFDKILDVGAMIVK